MSNDHNQTPPQSPGVRLFGELLDWAVTSIARAGAKFVESIANDTHKAVAGHAAKVEQLRDNVAGWRADNLGDVDDLPESLRGNGSNSSGSRSHTEVQS